MFNTNSYKNIGNKNVCFIWDTTFIIINYNCSNNEEKCMWWKKLPNSI